MYLVYILQSNKDGGYYIGCASNLEARVARHNSGKTKSLKNRRPLVLVYSERYNNKEEAYKREKEIKSYHGGVAFKNLISKSRMSSGEIA